MNIEDIFKQVIRPGDTVLDIGGYVGDVARFMADCTGPNGKVFSFEPHPDKFKILEARAEKQNNLNAFNCAVSNSSSPVTLYFSIIEKRAQASTICADLVTSQELGEGARAVEVPAITLDEFCAARNLVPSVIKIDVEGAEPLVLEGAKATLETHPILIFEMGVTKNLPDHLTALHARGYELYFVDIHRFVGATPSWDNIVNTETKALRNCIISFTDAAAEELAPFLSNILAVVPGRHASRIAGLRIVPLAEALPHFANPKKSLARKIKRVVRHALIPPALEERYPGLVVSLRNLANKIL